MKTNFALRNKYVHTIGSFFDGSARAGLPNCSAPLHTSKRSNPTEGLNSPEGQTGGQTLSLSSEGASGGISILKACISAINTSDIFDAMLNRLGLVAPLPES